MTHCFYVVSSIHSSKAERAADMCWDIVGQWFEHLSHFESVKHKHMAHMIDIDTKIVRLPRSRFGNRFTRVSD
jgi:hypothetical protein